MVTPNYNMAHLLPETIESVLANLRPGDEYFIIDGGSTDGSVEVIRRYESHLTGWVSEPDQGYADALAKGFRRCKGEFLCWLNSSDLLLKGALSIARELLMETGADLIYGDDVGMYSNGVVIAQNHWRVHSIKYMMLYGGWTLLQDACFWRRSLYERIGGINPKLKYAADYDFFLRASHAGKSVYAPVVFSAFREHDGQKSISGSSQYKDEKELARRQMLDQLNVPFFQRFVFETVYWFVVRWRLRVAEQFQATWVKAGAYAPQLPATVDPRLGSKKHLPAVGG
jgi:glycosyltransferase involved in cell wall biosynthesis